MENSTPSKKRSWLKIVLIASLGLNLLIAGLFIGSFAGGKYRSADRMPQTLGLGMMAYVKPLPKDERQALFRQFRKMKPARREAFQAMRAQNSKILGVITADPFDADALAAAFEEQHQVVTGVLSKGRSGLITVISEMTPDERKAYAAAVEEALKKRPKRKKKKSKPQVD